MGNNRVYKKQQVDWFNAWIHIRNIENENERAMN